MRAYRVFKLSVQIFKNPKHLKTYHYYDNYYHNGDNFCEIDPKIK